MCLGIFCCCFGLLVLLAICGICTCLFLCFDLWVCDLFVFVILVWFLWFWMGFLVAVCFVVVLYFGAVCVVWSLWVGGSL